MNRVYKVIWSKAKHCYVVTSEIARSVTKSASSARSAGRKGAAVLAMAALLFTAGGVLGEAANVTDVTAGSTADVIMVTKDDGTTTSITINDVYHAMKANSDGDGLIIKENYVKNADARVSTDGEYVKKDKKVGENLSALDEQVKTVEVAVNEVVTTVGELGEKVTGLDGEVKAEAVARKEADKDNLKVGDDGVISKVTGDDGTTSSAVNKLVLNKDGKNQITLSEDGIKVGLNSGVMDKDGFYAGGDDYEHAGAALKWDGSIKGAAGDFTVDTKGKVTAASGKIGTVEITSAGAVSGVTDLTVNGTFDSKTLSSTVDAKDDYTTINGGNVTSEVNDKVGTVDYSAESIFNKDGSSITVRTDEGIVDSTGKSIVGAKEISQYLGDNAKPEGSQKNVTRKMIRNNDGTFSMEDKAVDGTNKYSTVSQNAGERKVTVIDGNNKASTNLSNNGFNTFASDGTNKTYTKQTATDIKNTAEKGMISHTAKNLVNRAYENMTNTVDNDLTTTVGGNETRTVKGTLKETVTGNVTEDYKANLDTKVGGNETHYVAINQTNTVSGDRTVNVKGTEKENFNAQVTNVKTDQKTSVGGNQTNIVTGNQQNTVSGSKTETVKGAVTEKYGSQATTVDKDLTTTVGGNETHAVTGNQTVTVSKDRTVNVKGTETENFNAQVTNVKTDQKTSVGGNQTNIVTGNQQNTVSGSKTETVKGAVTEKYGSQATTVDKDLTTTVGGNETHAVTGNQTVTVSKDRTVNVKGTETENFNAQVTNVKTDQKTSVGGNQTNIVTGNQQNTVSGSKTETVKGAVTEKYGSQATTVNGDQSTNVGGNQSNVVKGNQTNTISGSKTESVKGAVTETYGSQSTTVNGNQSNTVKGTLTETVTGNVTEDYKANLDTTVGGNETRTVEGTLTETVTGDVTEDYKANLDTNVTGDSSLKAKNIHNTANEALTNDANTITNKAHESVTTQIGEGTAVKSVMDVKGIANTATGRAITNDAATITNTGIASVTNQVGDNKVLVETNQVKSAFGDTIYTTWDADGITNDAADKAVKTFTGNNTVISDNDGTTFENTAHSTAFKGGTVTKTTISGNTITTGKAVMDYANVTKDLSVGGDLNVDGNIETHDAVLSADSRQVVTGRQLYQTNERVDRLDNRIKKVGANAAALAALRPGDFNPDDKFSIAAGFGSYRNANAAALGLFYRPNENVLLSLGTSFGDGENMVNAGVSVKFGRGKSMAERRKEMADEVSSMRDEMRSQDERIAELEEMLKKQSELIEKLSKES
ncbi:bacteriophage T4 gp5 trimerisation domain-containing protein [Dialister succinatiphilus]|uniref:bacteriophage T4 gp5 trimerisation domain-containing protein n=1 Tax=Dialister succinatiphilus TaxID=487173 RepID=UPI004024D2E4